MDYEMPSIHAFASNVRVFAVMQQSENGIPLLEIKGLKTHFFTDRGLIKAVDDIHFRLMPGEVMGLIGESGSGKSVTALSIMGLVPSPPGRVVDGRIFFLGEDLLEKSFEEMIHIRGDRLAMIFQDPMTSLDPVFTVGEQLQEALLLEGDIDREQVRDRAVDLLARVGIPAAEQRLKSYPFQLSGGMRQRVMIALALSRRPSLLIADEPTTALDLTIQAQILALMRDLQSEFRMAIIFITHDFAVVSKMADWVGVMYAGKMVESAPMEVVFERPDHPYTVALMESRPVLGRRKRLVSITGQPPDLLLPPPGCSFAPRCREVVDECWVEVPEMRMVGEQHHVRCIRRG
jgi:oligopeptide transport system ATP-binding protein